MLQEKSVYLYNILFCEWVELNWKDQKTAKGIRGDQTSVLTNPIPI